MTIHAQHRSPSEHIRSGHTRSEHTRTYASGKTIVIRECLVGDQIVNEGVRYVDPIKKRQQTNKERKVIMPTENIQKPHMVKGHYRTNKNGERYWVEPFYKNVPKNYSTTKAKVVDIKERVEVVEQRPKTLIERIKAFFGF